MKSSINLKVGVTLLVIALAVGVFALIVWADGNGLNGIDDLRGEYRFSPYQIMEIAERIKTATAE